MTNQYFDIRAPSYGLPRRRPLTVNSFTPLLLLGKLTSIYENTAHSVQASTFERTHEYQRILSSYAPVQNNATDPNLPTVRRFKALY